MGEWRSKLERPKSRSFVLATIGIVALLAGLFQWLLGNTLARMTDEELVQSSHVHPSQYEEKLGKVIENRAALHRKDRVFGGALIVVGGLAIYFGFRPRRRKL